MRIVSVVMGSKSDLTVVQKAIDRLSEFGVPFEVRVLSAHRTPDELAEYARKARERGVGVVIAAAGMAAALPGAVAACTTLPVIGLPIKSDFMDGLDAVLSMCRMPPGVPVATVGTNAADNAALLAVQILAVSDTKAQEMLERHKTAMKNKVLQSDDILTLQSANRKEEQNG